MSQEFDFIEQGSIAAICFAGKPILQFFSHWTYFGGAAMCMNQCMRPGEEPEVNGVQLFAMHNHQNGPASFGFKLLENGNRFSLVVFPKQLLRTQESLQQVRETVRIDVHLEDGGFVWKQTIRIEPLVDLDVTSLNSNTNLCIYRFPHQDGRAGQFIQFADPQPCSASGPAVPMQRDWLGVHEPLVGPEGFRTHWRRRYVSILLPDIDGGYSYCDLNKSRWYWLVKDNRMARLCSATGRMYLLKENGSALEYIVDAPSHYHHVCEWGMDFHFWLDLELFLKDGIWFAGKSIEASTMLRLVPPQVTQPLVSKARRLELTARENSFADRPAYEEPENTFTVSCLERLDAQWWEPTSEGCSWEKTVGYRPGLGCLSIRNSYSNIGEWRQSSLGPQQWGNPFVAGACYRFSAWVCVEEIIWDSNSPGPQLGVEWVQINGPGLTSKRDIISGGWSKPLFTTASPWAGAVEWTRIEFLTTACPSNVGNANLILRFKGRGKVSFSGVSWEIAS